MAIKKIKLENFTIFNSIDIEFCDGINIFIGENGTGKTHLMKAMYSACQAARKDISFSNKLVRVFKSDELKISRLVNKNNIERDGNYSATILNNPLSASLRVFKP